MANALFPSIRQFSIVVKDLPQTVQTMHDTFGIGLWQGYHVTRDMVANMTYRGRRMDYAADVAVSYIGPIEIEVVQPLDEHNIYAEFLQQHGPGLHHICFDTEDFDVADAVLLAHGSPRILEGTMAGGTFFAYYDSKETLGCYLELRKPVADSGAAPVLFPCPRCSGPTPTPLFTGTRQIALVVEDLQRFVAQYRDLFGVQPWKTTRYDSTNISDMKRCGRPQAYAMNIGMCTAGDADMELVQPLDEYSIYAGFLREHGAGLHHICFETESFDRADSAMEAAGCPKIQEGIISGETRYAYYDALERLGFCVELYGPVRL